MLAIASRELGHAVPASVAHAIHEAVEDHELSRANDWHIPLLLRLIDNVPTTEPVKVPSGYADGENGFANLLADLDSAA